MEDDGDLRRAFEAGWAANDFMGNLMSAREAYDLYLRANDLSAMKASGRRRKTALATCQNPTCGVLFQQQRRGRQRERFCSRRCVYRSWRTQKSARTLDAVDPVGQIGQEDATRD
jgi:hypothetical protein